VNSKHLLWLLVLVSALALMGCEGDQGPAGPAGTDGTDGTDGTNGTSIPVCLECHGSDADFLQIQLEYVQSGHKAGLYVDYAGGREACARCHSKQGFVEYAVMGDVTGDISDPVAIDCATCHTVHPFTFGVRLNGPVTLVSDGVTVVDFGDNSNLCANCHQARTAPPEIAAPADSASITSTHYGPHHGPQAMVLWGTGFSEIAGSTSYPANSLHLSQGATCTTCHMAEYEAGEGGHTWNPALSACNGCHFSPDTDFNHGNVQTETQDNLDALRDLLVDQGVVEYVAADDAYEPVVGKYPMIQVQAYFNWIGLTEDRSLGVHNPPYVNALLENTIEALSAPMN